MSKVAAAMSSAFVRFSLPGEAGAALPARAKLVHFLRHGQATHNVHTEYKSEANIDARLTELGRQQCADLAATIESLQVDLVVSSPLTRTLQTAQLSFCSQLKAGVPLQAEETARETVNYLCDTRRPTADLRADFPEVDFSRIEDEEDAVWAKYAAKFGDQAAFGELRESVDDESLAQRATQLMHYLASLQATSIAVVSHRAFLRYIFSPRSEAAGIVGFDGAECKAICVADFENCELRTLVAEFGET
mmetsp:Transcript_20338/g.45597  ORF Transcript_20338/g.45597 Transcript_20338/m.45597 type:complete len:248 (-) Transcript_20338:62-805(-)